MSSKLMKSKNRCRGQSGVSPKTTEFLQKICYRKAASVDMTQYGFARGSLLFETTLHREENRGSKNQKPNQPRFSNKVIHNEEKKRKKSLQHQQKLPEK